MTDPFDTLAADLRCRSQKEWELLIIADWPNYSASAWPKVRHAPFAAALPPEKWCQEVRKQRQAVSKELQKAGRATAITDAEGRAMKASTDATIDTAGKWTDMLGLPMYVQAAKSVLWIIALHPQLTTRQFRALWDPYASVAGFLAEFEREHLPERSDADLSAAPSKGLLGRLFGGG